MKKLFLYDLKQKFLVNMLQHKPNSQLVSIKSEKDVCPRQDGCCRCDSLKELNYNSKEDENPNNIEKFRGENAMFEDALQNKVFVQK